MNASFFFSHFRSWFGKITVVTTVTTVILFVMGQFGAQHEVATTGHGDTLNFFNGTEMGVRPFGAGGRTNPRLSTLERQRLEAKVSRLEAEMVSLREARQIREDGELDSKYNPGPQLGRIAYAVPDAMEVGRTSTVWADVVRTGGDSLMISNGFSFGKEPTKTTTIKVGRRMKLALRDPSGEQFYITPLQDDEPQLVATHEPTRWQWNVRPQSAGKGALLLQAVIVHDNGNQMERVFSKPVRVLSNYWWSLANLDREYKVAVISTLFGSLLSLAGWAASQWWERRSKPKRSRRKPSGPPPPSAP